MLRSPFVEGRHSSRFQPRREYFENAEVAFEPPDAQCINAGEGVIHLSRISSAGECPKGVSLASPFKEIHAAEAIRQAQEDFPAVALALAPRRVFFYFVQMPLALGSLVRFQCASGRLPQAVPGSSSLFCRQETNIVRLRRLTCHLVFKDEIGRAHV